MEEILRGIELKSVTKRFGPFTALHGIDLAVECGEFVAVVGKSGSGKSTLLNILSGIDSPDTGEVWVGGVAIHSMDQDSLAQWRGRNVGVIFQFFQLLPTLTILENVLLPMDFCKIVPANERNNRALQLLAEFGIEDQAKKLPFTLSGGQQQRAAMARALANDPPFLMADEPTGNLDSYTAESVLQSFQLLNSKGKTIVMVTHEKDVKPHVHRFIELVDGRIAESTQVAGIK